MRLGIKVKKDKEELHRRIIMSVSTVNSSKKKDATFDIKRQGVGCHNSLVIPQESPCNATGKKIIHTQPKTFAGPMDFTL